MSAHFHLAASGVCKLCTSQDHRRSLSRSRTVQSSMPRAGYRSDTQSPIHRTSSSSFNKEIWRHWITGAEHCTHLNRSNGHGINRRTGSLPWSKVRMKIQECSIGRYRVPQKLCSNQRPQHVPSNDRKLRRFRTLLHEIARCPIKHSKRIERLLPTTDAAIEEASSTGFGAAGN